MNISKLVDLVGPTPTPTDMPAEVLQEMKEAKRCAMIRYLIVMAIVLILLLLLGKYLWNHSLVPHVTILRPMESIWPLLGIMILISILHGGVRA